MRCSKIICLVIVAWILTCVSNAIAQSRTPEIEIPKTVTVKSDTSEFDERPYFILIGESEKALSDSDYKSAALRLVEAMGVEPDNPLNIALMSNLGMIYFYDGQDSLALSCLDKVVQQEPALVMGHENRARVLSGLGRDREALAEYGKVIELDSLNTDARFYHGMMSLYGGNMSDAEQDFAVLERVIPLARTTYLAMGTLYAMTGRDKQAIPYWRKLVDVEPAAEYIASLSGCYLATGDLVAASDMIVRGLELYPEDGELYYYRAWLKRDRYQMDEAKDDAQKALSLGVNKQKIDALFK